MRRFSVLVSAFLFSGSAFAADLPSRMAPVVAPAPVAPLFTWSGLYVGVNAGYLWSSGMGLQRAGAPIAGCPAGLGCVGDAETALAGAIALYGNVPLAVSGFIGGAQVGYNWQASNRFVFGVEADIQGSTARVSTTSASVAGLNGFPANAVASVASDAVKLDMFGTARARLGVTPFTPNLMFYGTGGLAWGHVRTSTAISQALLGPVVGLAPGGAVGIASTSGLRVGWTVGAGAEWAFADNWSLKAEWLYFDLGRTRFATSAIVPSTIAATGVPYALVGSATSVRTAGHIVRAGLNYRFGFGGNAAALARY